jgi:hypothetical protein
MRFKIFFPTNSKASISERLILCQPKTKLRWRIFLEIFRPLTRRPYSPATIIMPAIAAAAAAA